MGDIEISPGIESRILKMADHFKSAPINEVPSYQKRISATNQSEPPRKKIKQLLTEETPSSSENESSGGVPLHFTPLSSDITINEEFARRFEHNKRREELLKRTISSPKTLWLKN